MPESVPRRKCCDSHIDFAHVRYCKWAREHCPAWLDPFLTDALDPGTRCTAYKEALRETILMKTFPNGDKKAGKVTYCWMGRNGWPTLFQVQGNEWKIDEVVCLNGNDPCIYPRLPTAEEMYELLTKS